MPHHNTATYTKYVLQVNYNWPEPLWEYLKDFSNLKRQLPLPKSIEATSIRGRILRRRTSYASFEL